MEDSFYKFCQYFWLLILEYVMGIAIYVVLSIEPYQEEPQKFVLNEVCLHQIFM